MALWWGASCTQANPEIKLRCRTYNRISSLGGAGGLLSDNGGGTLEEREARAMASTTALRRDLAPIVGVRVVQGAGGNTEHVCFVLVTQGRRETCHF